MPRIRTIKPEFWLNEELAQVSTEACLLAIGLLNLADDEGYFNANEKLVQAAIFPLRELSGSTTGMLRELSGIGYFDLFSGSDFRVYGRIKNFERHQVINKKTPSKIKDLCGLPYYYGSATVGLPPGKERKGKERKGMETDNYTSPSASFAEFWEKYPVSKRKAAKTKCEQVWQRKKLDDVAKIIFAHLDSVDDDYRKESCRYCPAPLAYLNGEKWDGFDPGEQSSDDDYLLYLARNAA